VDFRVDIKYEENKNQLKIQNPTDYEELPGFTKNKRIKIKVFLQIKTVG
jgi:hypothetical protein